MSTERPGGVAIGIGLLLGLATALLALGAAGVGPAVAAGAMVSVVSYVAAVFAARAGHPSEETRILPSAGDPASPPLRRAERAAAAATALLDSVAAGPLRDQVRPLRRDLTSAVGYARELAAQHATLRAPLAGLDATLPEERDAANRLGAVAQAMLERLSAHAARLERIAADLGELTGLDLAARQPLGADREEELRALRAAFAEMVGAQPRTLVEPSVDNGAPPATIKEPLNERTG